MCEVDYTAYSLLPICLHVCLSKLATELFKLCLGKDVNHENRGGSKKSADQIYTSAKKSDDWRANGESGKRSSNSKS